MRPFTATSSQPTEERKSGMIVSKEASCGDVENQLDQIVPTHPSCCSCHNIEMKLKQQRSLSAAEQEADPVAYHCSLCQYFLCEDCYTNELKRLNNIPAIAIATTAAPVTHLTDKEEEEHGSVDPHDIELGYGAPTESGDTEEDRISTHLHHFKTGGDPHRVRQFETMSTQVEVDNFSVKSNTDVTSNSDYIHIKPSHSALQLSSEDALSDHDLESISTSTQHFRLFPQQILPTSRKMSVGGLTYSSLDSDSLKDDDDSMSHFRVEGRVALAENRLAVDDDDNMTSVSTIHSDGGLEVSSLLIANLPPPPPLRNPNRSRRLSIHSQEDNQSVGGGQTCTSYSAGPHSEGEDEDEEREKEEEREEDEEDQDKDQEDEEQGLERRPEQVEDSKQDSQISNADGNGAVRNEDGDESGSDGDGGLDDEDMSIGSIDSTKCYPNNLYHSKGFLTIASLHKTDSPSGYLTHHLSSIPSTASLRYTSNHTMRRYSKLPSPSHSHFNSSLVEEEEVLSHHSSPLPPSSRDSPSTLPPLTVLPSAQESPE
jgi:hypothetical protein